MRCSDLIFWLSVLQILSPFPETSSVTFTIESDVLGSDVCMALHLLGT